MDESKLWRRLLVNNLLEASARFAFFAKLFGSFVRPVFDSLSEERAQQARVILQEHPDTELSEALALEDASRPDGIDQQVELAAREGEVYAAEVAIRNELKTLDLIEGMSETELPEPLRLELEASLRDGVERLQRAVQRTRLRGEGIELSSGQVEKGARPDDGDRIFDVWFGTNRMPIEKDGVTIGFSGDTGPLLTLGLCGVTIPRSHRIGESKPPLWRRALLGERPLSLETVAVLVGDEFWAGVRERLVRDGAEPEDAIVFVHGYNVSFEEAAVCAAQIGADLNLPGAVAFFSWPSRGSMHAYPADEASIEASEAMIADFLEHFAARSGARRVHLIAHSMGNRGLLRAMDRIAAKASRAAGKPFGQIILAAPDVDRRTFAMLCKAYSRVGSRTTLYVSSKDVAVRSSRFVHAAARVGYEPPVTILPNIDTVSVSKVDLSLLGHGYVAACRTVLTDIHQLIVSGLAPNRRAGMTALESGEGSYWELAA